MKRYSRTGFTLIELLVVITIIGLLMALLFSVASNARERARDARCIGNLKQLHTAVLNSCTGGGGMPAACSAESRFGQYGPNGNFSWVGWKQSSVGWVDWYDYDAVTASTDAGTSRHGDCRTYWYGDEGKFCITNGSLWGWTGKSYGIYLCPTFARKYRGPGGEEAVRSYVMNYNAPGSITVGNAFRVILFGDGSYWELEPPQAGGARVCNRAMRDTTTATSVGGNSGRRWFTQMDGRLQGSLWNSGRPEERLGSYHTGKANVVFVDGHVEKVEYTDTMDVCAGNWGDY